MSYSRSTTRVRSRRGFTLVEILVATALTLIIMAVTVTLFGSVTENIAGSRAVIETNDRLRATQERLVQDLRGVTAPMAPPLRPEWGLGYFEYVEGTSAPTPLDHLGAPDTTIGDTDDLLMFTTRSSGDPFVGKSGANTALSQVAEVCWFMRGTTLYRRVLLVLPGLSGPATPGFYGDDDISVRQIGGSQDPIAGAPATPFLVGNSLGDLTKRENRYGHEPRNRNETVMAGFPHSVSRWGQLGLPTLFESSSSTWPFPAMPSSTIFPIPVAGLPTAMSTKDYWTNPNDFRDSGGNLVTDLTTGTLLAHQSSTRFAEDVILTNVIGFDVKAWDPNVPLFLVSGSVIGPDENDQVYRQHYRDFTVNNVTANQVGYGGYVNLGYATGFDYSTLSAANARKMLTFTAFSSAGKYPATLPPQLMPLTRPPLPNTYDTWSLHYEMDGINQDLDSLTDEGADGIDNDLTGGVDDVDEMEAPPPYPAPLRGIQVKIRVFEPDSRSIREVTVVQDFLPE